MVGARSLDENRRERMRSRLMFTAVQVFKGSINEIQDLINNWAQREQVTILNTSMCYDEPAGFGSVFVMVVYQRTVAAQPTYR